MCTSTSRRRRYSAPEFVELCRPADPSSRPLHAGQTLDGKRVTVEINTVFEQLTSLLSKIEPDKLNETLGALASALEWPRRKIGQTFGDLDAFLAKLDPSLQALRHDIAVTPAVVNAYADAAHGPGRDRRERHPHQPDSQSTSNTTWMHC